MQYILLLLILYNVGSAYGDSEQAAKEKNVYAFYYPLGMLAQQPAKVCLEINKDLLPVKVKISVNKTCEGKTCEPHLVTSGFSCWEIIAPAQTKYSYEVSTIEIEIETKDKNVKFSGEGKVQILWRQEELFSETDRKVYKPGDTVKIRLLALGYDFKPIENYKLSLLKVTSPYPTNAIVKEWKDVSTEKGLAQLEFQLAPDTPEGAWSITGEDVYMNFDVKKYVLPRFQTKIDGPTSIYNGSETVPFKVCAKYSYGQNVKGTALLEAKTRAGYMEDPSTVSEIKELSGGCAKFDVPTEGLQLSGPYVWAVDVTGSVTEDGTNQVETANQQVYINKEPYSYEWDYTDRYLKPELPYTTKFSLSNLHVPLDSRLVEFCYKQNWDGNSMGCSNFTLDSTNSVEVTVPPLRNVSDSNNIRIEAKVLDHPMSYNPSKYLTLWHSGNKHALKITSSEGNPKECESALTFTVLYNSGGFEEGQEIEFKYILSSKGAIISTGSVTDKPKKNNLKLDDYPNVIGKEDYEESEENPVDKFELKIKLDEKVYTNAKLLVYYEYDNEVTADYLKIDVVPCTPNKVEAKWAESPLYPGEIGKLNIKTGPQSLCSVSSVDKASKFLGTTNPIDAKNVINRFNTHTYVNSENCIKPENNTEGATTTTIAPYRHYYSPLYDTSDAFKENNVGTISNMKFISKKCQVHSLVQHLETRHMEEPAVYHSSPGGAAVFSTTALAGAPHPVAASADRLDAGTFDNRGSAVRSFFPETWLWDLVPVGDDGQIAMDRTLPDSITDWQGNVLCVSPQKGFGMSGTIEIKGFKPFFVDVLLPYSIKRNKEILHMPVPIFNYLNHSLPIRVVLQPSDDIVLIDGEDKASHSMCLGAGDSYTHNYRIKATKLGNVKVTVSADVDPAYAKDCASDSVIRRRDVIQKPVLVEPEGFPSSLSRSALLCANDTSGVDHIEWDISLPENVVQDTVDGKVIINSDILGPMFQNLESILVVPTGCGEQTMATLTPNLYVLKYLEANGALTDEIRKKILKNLEIGYQRMLMYIHSDGSFSAFGGTDPNGSMFLTSFVIRTFRQMKKYVFIDDDVINKAVRWIISHQLENGCFDPVHHVFHEMGLASSKNQTTALTSYVLISFLETNTDIDPKILSNAKDCILQDSSVDKYTLAISSYALGLLKLPEDVQKRLDKLTEVASHKDDLTWWKQSEKTLSANVEVSSYVLMSLLQQNPVENLGTARSIVAWLQTQMNPRGGFFSTTDTVVGLDSISRYATLVNKKEPHVKVSASTNSNEIEVKIDKRDNTKTEVLPLTSYPNKVKAKIVGDGCVSIQASVTYYIDKPIATDDLKLDINLKPVNQKLKCSLVELKPCVSYQAPGQINMAIVEVSMPSGYAPDQASLYALTSNRDSIVRKFEQIKNQVVFYLTQLGSTEVCLPFTIDENLIVENVANATVKLYDYYKPELSVSKSFRIEDCQANVAVEA